MMLHLPHLRNNKKDITESETTETSEITVNNDRPTSKMIRELMEKTGWSAYDCYCKLVRISKIRGVSYKAVMDQQLWREYKLQEAQASISMEGADNDLLGDHPEIPLLSEGMFNHFFYTKAQGESIRKIETGPISLDTLMNYLKTENPMDASYDTRKDISRDIAYTLSGAKRGDIFLSSRRIDMAPDKVQRKGVSCIISYPNRAEILGNLPIPFVPRPHVYSFMTEMAAFRKKKYKGRTVAVSGSIGKTTTTEMLAAVMRSHHKTFKVPGNRNTTTQIAETVFKLKDEFKVYVQECSGSYLGQLETTSRILRPEIFALTNIGNGHIGNYGGKQELLLYEKTALDRNAAPGGIGIINWDDEHLNKVAYRHQIIRIAIKDTSADIIAENIVEKNGKIFFDIVENNNGGLRTKARLNLCGLHNVYNALTAFAAGLLCDVPREKIVRALANYRTGNVRQNLTQYGKHRVYADCYSTTMESVQTSMEVLKTITVPKGDRKIAVFGEVPDLGDESAEKHREIGRRIAKMTTADVVLLVGPDMAYAYEEAKKGSFICRHTNDRLELEQWLKELGTPNGLALFKASHKSAFQWVLDDLYGTDYYAYDDTTMTSPAVRMGNVVYKCIDDYGSVLLGASKEIREVHPMEQVEGLDLRIIGRLVFAGKAVPSFKTPDTVTCISDHAFFNCKELYKVEFPSSLKYIGASAFAGCEKLELVDLSAGCETISEFAFNRCPNLKLVILPPSVGTIERMAFGEKPTALFCVQNDSYAHRWAKARKFNTLVVDRL